MDSVAGMRVFVRVVDAGSFSAAGRHLGIAPSSVSRQINELEEDLGVR
ncbi:MAG: LysR family transcriptional regulator, partial [Pseudomonadota bacterium]|nr:LysR family transcriptional regulator [Pseudomonadota bacterium]